MDVKECLTNLGVGAENLGVWLGGESRGQGAGIYSSYSPVDGKEIAKVAWASVDDYEDLVPVVEEAAQVWRRWPAPQRGEVVRQIGVALRRNKADLGALVSLEMGKSLQEGLGEVQEMIDVCDFACGLSRQLYGLTMPSERAEHRLFEQWHPLGVVGIISAFNFPVAVWSWNAFIAAVCGNASIWKPSEKTPLVAIACFKIIGAVLEQNQVPKGTFAMISGGSELGECLSADRRLPLVSATGSVRMGRRVGAVVAGRLGRSILELGGNNAIIITPEARLDLAIPAVVFGAVGTAGQRCTSTRRLIIHQDVYEKVVNGLLKAYRSLRIGSPLDESQHMGPLIDREAVAAMQAALEQAQAQGGKVLWGGEVLSNLPSDCYVRPALVEIAASAPIVQEETFAPVLYLLQYNGDIEAAIALQNGVPQGLSSACFSDNLQETEVFLSGLGSDCGIANVNIGTSGAEIGGAFGGEKDTGGGRESGSDSWKAYMRRQTNTVNYGKEAPLAQGIRFDLT